jgi:hypothetical protein
MKPGPACHCNVPMSRHSQHAAWLARLRLCMRHCCRYCLPSEQAVLQLLQTPRAARLLVHDAVHPSMPGFDLVRHTVQQQLLQSAAQAAKSAPAAVRKPG